MKLPELRPGMAVRDGHGRKLGRIIDVEGDRFAFDKGLFSRPYNARLEQVERSTDEEVWLGSERWTPRASGSEEVAQLRLLEEELDARVRLREAGRVRLRKEVVVEERTVTIPVRRERLRIERIPAGADAALADEVLELGEESIDVPLHEETIEIRRRPVVRELVRVFRERFRVDRRVGARVRRERLVQEPVETVH